jgi:DNA polymerase-4
VLKARYADFRTVTRSRTVPHILADRASVAQLGHALLDQILPTEMGIRLLGLTLSGLIDAQESENEHSEQGYFAFEPIEE